MWFVYILKSDKFKKSYVGCSDNVERRLKEHNMGKGLYSRRFKPWSVIKTETFLIYNEARKRERYYKSGLGREEMKKLFKELS